MNREYLLTPVIKMNDGQELKSFRMYYLFVIAGFFGLLPTLILCTRNCLWLGAKKVTIILIIALSILLLIIKFSILGSYYTANSQQLKESYNAKADNYIQDLKNKSNADKPIEEENENPISIKWENYKSNFLVIEKLYSFLLLGVTYLLYRGNYKIVVHLTGNLQPLFKWAGIGIVAYFLFEIAVSKLFYGGFL